MALIDVKSFTADNGSLKMLSELIFLATVAAGSLDKVATVLGGVQNGKKINGVAGIGLIGSASTGCETTYQSLSLKGIEKTWNLGEWEIPLKLCYDEIKGKLMGLSLKQGIAIEDMRSDEFVTGVVEPLLRTAIEQMLWRLAWFGDKSATNVTSGGVITDGVDLKYFTLIDGFWKQIFSAITENPRHRVTIAANSQATLAGQFDGLYTKGVVTKIFDDLKRVADSRLWNKQRVQVVATKSLVDALEWDVKETNKGGDLAYTDLLNGMQLTKYRGMDIVSCPIFDTMIAENENKGATLNLPHRAVLCSAADLLVGTGSTNSLDQVNMGYNEENGHIWLKAKDTIGAVIVEDNLLAAAY